MLQRDIARVLGSLLVVALATAVPLAGQAGGGQISGTITNESTGEPVGAVQVFIDGTTRGTITRADGSYTLSNVPPGAHTVVARSIGYQQYRRADVDVLAAQTTSLDLRLRPTVVALQEVVVTGLLDPTDGMRSPITVSAVTREQMPFPALGQPLEMLQGLVPALTLVRTTGQPGSDLAPLLRTPSSARGSNAPLMVVDGVILGSGTVEIEPMNVRHIEVIKGAAAAALYGTRGANGVIAITTSRGSDLAAGRTRFTANSEFGVGISSLSMPLPTHHAYLVNGAGDYVNLQGEVVPGSARMERPASLGGAFMDQPRRGPLHDNLASIYRPGNYNAHVVTLDSNSESTNFSISLSRYDEPGLIDGHSGYDRNTLRANLDHRFLSAFSLGLNAYHSRSFRDLIDGGVTGTPVGSLMHDLLAVSPEVDLRRTGEDGLLLKTPDPALLLENPLWRQATWETDQTRGRSLAHGELRWNPTAWFAASGEIGFDRQEHRQQRYVAKRIEESVVDPFPTDGSLAYLSSLNDTFNGSAQATFRRDFGLLSGRSALRATAERDVYVMITAIGEDFNVGGVPRINPGRIQRGSGDLEEVRSLSYLWDTALDFDDRYFAQLMLRREASSVFAPIGSMRTIERMVPGEEQPVIIEEIDLDPQWYDFYRAAFAYRISEEPWFNLRNVDEVKLRYARGTAGGRPPAFAYSEAWFLDPAGINKRGILGNRDLRPEHTLEQEFGIDMILFGRVGLELAHARQRTTDQIIDLPFTAATGYNRRWENQGTMVGSTTELRLETRVINGTGFNWSTILTADRSRSEITDWSAACLQEGITKLCNGSSLRDIWTYRWLRSPSELPSHLQAHANEFQVNDDGYLVWVGGGNSYRDGVARGLWGTHGTIAGESFGWGLPVLEAGADGMPIMHRTGNGDPDVQFGWLNQVRFGNVSLHAHLHAAIGNDLMNLTRQHLAVSDRLPEMDQAGKPDEAKKPMHYYRHLYSDGRVTDHFVEDASFLKLRTLSATYRFAPAQLDRIGFGRMGATGLDVTLVGRNLLTFSGYSGLDPEFLGHDPSISAWNRLVPVDFYGYPPRPSLSAAVGIAF